jgi:hypothetical protein
MTSSVEPIGYRPSYDRATPRAWGIRRILGSERDPRPAAPKPRSPAAARLLRATSAKCEKRLAAAPGEPANRRAQQRATIEPSP